MIDGNGDLAWPHMAHVSEQSRRRGARLTVSPYRKFDASMMPTTAKACGQYLNSRLATMEASRRGYDEALLLNIEGNVAEAAVANVFVVNGRTLRTNDEKSSILMGITRDSILQLAVAEGFDVEVGTITVEDLRQADEVFLCGTASRDCAGGGTGRQPDRTRHARAGDRADSQRIRSREDGCFARVGSLAASPGGRRSMETAVSR